MTVLDAKVPEGPLAEKWSKARFDLKLVNRVSAPGKSLDEAIALAETIAANGPRAVRAALEVILKTSVDPDDFPVLAGKAIEAVPQLLQDGRFSACHGILRALRHQARQAPCPVRQAASRRVSASSRCRAVRSVSSRSSSSCSG